MLTSLLRISGVLIDLMRRSGGSGEVAGTQREKPVYMYVHMLLEPAAKT
jgi:hypothetical protein